MHGPRTRDADTESFLPWRSVTEPGPCDQARRGSAPSASIDRLASFIKPWQAGLLRLRVGARAAADTAAAAGSRKRKKKQKRKQLTAIALRSFPFAPLLSSVLCPLSLIKASYYYRRHTRPSSPCPPRFPGAPAVAVLARAGERPSRTSKQHGLRWAPRSCTPGLSMAASRGGRRWGPSPCYLHACSSNVPMSRVSMPPHFTPRSTLCSSVLELVLSRSCPKCGAAE